MSRGYELDKATAALQSTVRRLDLKQARVRRITASSIVVDSGGGAGSPSLTDVAARSTGAEATIPTVTGSIAIVQHATNAEALFGFVDVTLPAVPTAGNLLLCWATTRDIHAPLGPTGWTAHPGGVAVATPPSSEQGALFYKIAGASESATIRVQADSGTAGLRGTIVEISRATTLAGSAELEDQNGDALSLSVTPAGTDPIIIVGGFVVRTSDAGSQSVTPDANSTELVDTGFNDDHPLHWLGFRTVDAPSGAYAIGGTCSQAGRDWAGQALAFAAPTAATAWTPAFGVTDGNDATYDYIYDNQTTTLRLVLSDAFEIARARLRIGIQNAGAVSYVIQAATLADFSDAATVATMAFTATGSYTAQDVEVKWTSTGAFRYWQLVGPAENRHIHAFELYEAVIDTGADLTAHIADPTDAHDASAVSVLDTAGYFVGTDVEAILAAIAAGDLTAYLTVVNGGGGTVQAHGNLGAAETIDTANGNYHWGTLNANCTVTFTTIADTAERWFTLELIEDGTGGWTVTWPGSVSWLGGTIPTHTSTAGTTTIYAFFTRNGGTTWIGAQLGAGPTFATPAIVLGTAAAAGSAATAIRSDATIVAFDATIPANIPAPGVASATGSVAFAAHRDHGHALTYHDEPLTDGASNFIFAGGDIVVVIGVANP